MGQGGRVRALVLQAPRFQGTDTQMLDTGIHFELQSTRNQLVFSRTPPVLQLANVVASCATMRAFKGADTELIRLDIAWAGFLGLELSTCSDLPIAWFTESLH